MAFTGFQLTGLHARSEELVKATRDLDRKRVSEAECEQVRRKDAEALVELQKKLGAEQVYDGGFRWQDLLRPFAEKSMGLGVGPLTRWFETNSFYKMPLRKGKLAGAEFIAEYAYADALPANRKAVLPGPYTFARLAEIGEESIAQAAELLLGAAQALERKNFTLIQFSEPSLAYDAGRGKLGADALAESRQAYAKLRRGLKARILLHTFFGDFAKARGVEDFAVDAIGIDFTRTNLEEVKADFGSKAVGLGVADAESSLVEEPAEIAAFAQRAAEKLRAKSFFLCPNTGLDYVPRVIADRKVEALAKAARILGGQS